MKRTIAAGIVALSVIGGVGAGYAVAGNDTPTRQESPSADAFRPVIEPGRIGQVAVGMSVTEAERTGFIEKDTARGEGCGGDFYKWTGKGTADLDVIFVDGTIAALGSRSTSVATAGGLTVGSTADQVRQAYGDGLIEMTSDYGQPGLLVHEGDAWIGFLFGEVTPDTLTGGSKVTFVEVTGHDQRPSLLRDGC